MIKRVWHLVFGMMLLFVALTRSLAGPSVLIQTEVNPKSIYIGDPIEYRVTVTYSSSVTSVPLKMEKIWGEFELLDMKSLPPAPSKDGKTTLRHVLLLTSFSTGSLTIPGLPLTFSAPDGALSEAKTENIEIRVKSLLEEKGDEGHLRPLKGLFNFRSYLWLWILLGTVAFVGLIYGLFQWRKHRRGEGLMPKEPARPPEEVAKERLDALDQTELTTPEQFKEFYLQLSVICREYLERRYTMSAMEKTTSELMMEFRSMNMGLTVVNLLRELFDNGDLVKFAKFLPTSEDAKKDLDRARQLVALTTPQTTIPKPEDEVPV